MSDSELARPTEAEVLDLAFELYAEKERTHEREERERTLAAAAKEVGVPEEYLERARELIRERNAAKARRRRRLKRWALGTACGLTAIGAAAWFVYEPPPQPFSEQFSSLDDWTLNKNPASQASVEVVASGPDRLVQIRVERFVPLPDGKYHVNLDRSANAPELDDYSAAIVRARARGLPVMRLYLEYADERWRSPAISLHSELREQHLSFEAFEHQRRAGGEWKAAGGGKPEGVPKISFKLGHYMNSVDATGEVELDELRFE